MRAHLRERVSSPCGDDGEVEPADHPPGGGGCAALLISSRCMEFLFTVREDLFIERTVERGSTLVVNKKTQESTSCNRGERPE